MNKFAIMALIATLTTTTYQISGVVVWVASNPFICPAPEALTAYRNWVTALSHPGFPGLSQDFATNSSALTIANNNYQLTTNILLKNSASQPTVAGSGLGSYTCKSVTDCLPLISLYLYQNNLYILWLLQNGANPASFGELAGEISNALNSQNFYVSNVSPIELLDSCANAVLGKKNN